MIELTKYTTYGRIWFSDESESDKAEIDSLNKASNHKLSNLTHEQWSEMDEALTEMQMIANEHYWENVANNTGDAELSFDEIVFVQMNTVVEYLGIKCSLQHIINKSPSEAKTA